MTKMLTFRSLLLVIILAVGSQVSIAQTPFWTETFTDSIGSITKWVETGINGGPVDWAWTTDLDAGAWNGPTVGLPTGSTGYFWFDSDANGAGFPYDVNLTGTGAAASCTGKSNVHLKFSTYFRTFSGTDVARIGISTNGGTTFTYHNVPEFDALTAESANNFQFYEGDIDIAIPEADNQASVIIRFNYAGEYEYYWKVDDLELYEFVPSAVNVKFSVNMTLETVDAAGVFLTGDFNNWTNELMTNEGNGVWSLTKALSQFNDYFYKFKNGPTTAETVPPACGIADLGGTLNRGITPTEDVVLPVVCYASCAACVLPCNLNPNAIICDDFETYTIGNVSPQATWWLPWNLVDSSPLSAEVSTTFASNGTKSMKVKLEGAGDDQLLLLGNKSTGRYSLKWKQYVPVGNAGYFNIQTDQNAPGASNANFSGQVYFNVDGTYTMDNPAPTITGTYPQGSWFTIEMIMDLDNNQAKLYINGILARIWSYPQTFGAIDFYSADATYTYYVDEVEYVSLPAIVYNVDVCDAAVDLYSYFGGAPGVPQTTPLQDNSTATPDANDPSVSCWGENTVNTSMWYTFIGDGNPYHIETVPCNATNYIGGVNDPGDTQMLVYSGDNCSDLTEIACNDDLYPTTGDPDWRAAVDIQTEYGVNYYMLIDGYKLGAVVATGEFCIEITQVATVTCAEGAVGNYSVPNPYLCFEAELADLFTLDDASFVLPTNGPVAGMSWALSTAPVPAGTWPADAAGYIISTGFLNAPFSVGYQNIGPDATPNPGFPFGIYYATPVVLGGGTVIDPTMGVTIGNVDPSAGCAFVGESTQIFFLPLLDDITATVTTGSGTVNLTPAGGLPDVLGDPTLYIFDWSNGATTEDLSGVPAGTYTCTVSDASGCALEAVVTAQVSVGTKDPASVQSFTVSPNPTAGAVMVTLALGDVSDVRIEVLNTLGQTIQTINAGKVLALNQAVELGNLAQGSYFLRITVDGETAIRRVVLQR